jgi:hypothetical protein
MKEKEKCESVLPGRKRPPSGYHASVDDIRALHDSYNYRKHTIFRTMSPKATIDLQYAAKIPTHSAIVLNFSMIS